MAIRNGETAVDHVRTNIHAVGVADRHWPSELCVLVLLLAAHRFALEQLGHRITGNSTTRVAEPLSIFAGLSGLGSVYAENANFNIEQVAVHWLRTSFDIAGKEDGGVAK